MIYSASSACSPNVARADFYRLYEIVEKVESMPDNSRLVGGAGGYCEASHHRGFICLDAHGYRARWEARIPLVRCERPGRSRS